jgi:hypothetical protein
MTAVEAAVTISRTRLVQSSCVLRDHSKKQESRNHQAQVFEEGDFRIQFDEITKTSAVGDPHLLFHIRSPLGKIEEIGFGWHKAGQVGKASQHGENDHQQEEKPGREFAPPANNKGDAQHDFKHNHADGKTDTVFGQPGK